MSKGLLISRSKKIALGKLASRTPTAANIDIFKKFRNLYNVTLRAGKKLYYEKELKLNQSNLKKSWHLLKKAANLSSSTSDPPSCFIIGGSTISDPIKMANELNSFFANMPSEIVNNIPPAPELIIDDPLINGPTLDFADVPVSDQELLDAIAQLSPKTSLDFNHMSMSFLKQIIPVIFVPLKHVISLSLHHGSVPTQFKIAKIVPIFKSGDNQTWTITGPFRCLVVSLKFVKKLLPIVLPHSLMSIIY
jgi:hypothetical protein